MLPEQAMQRAITLGERGRITAPPNPWVGCVIVKDNKIIGEGFHHAAGTPHAEVHALDQAGALAAGATAYVTLEPCSHHGRTPPCAEALIQAKIAHVVVAVEDPDQKVRGKGIEMLRAAGIEVSIGVAAEEATASLLPYLHHRRTGRPYCWVKSAISLDGRIAADDRSSQWITGPEARADVHRLRAESQAILIGVGTAIHDSPTLTVRDCETRPPNPPLRVVLDARGTLPATGPLFESTLAPTLLFTATDPHPWTDTGVMVKQVACDDKGHLDVMSILEQLGSMDILQVLVEGGSKLYTSFLKQNLVDHITLYMGPRILGSQGLPLFSDYPIATIDDAPVLHLERVQRFGQTVRMDYRP